MSPSEQQFLYTFVGARIRETRLKSVGGTGALTQSDLAKLTSVSRTSIVNIEKGRQRPPLHLLWQIAEVLGVHVSEFLPSRNVGLGGEENADLMGKIHDQVPGDVDAFEKIRELVLKLDQQNLSK